MRLRLIVFGCIVALGSITKRAQQGDQVLQFEISKDVKGGLEWVSFEGHAIRLSISWIQ
jgi:hypothetical protein